MKFSCQRCGSCCKLAFVKVLAEPELADVFICREDGSCGHLKKNKEGVYYCDIYQTRPNSCRSDWVVKNLGPSLSMKTEDYDSIAPRICRALRAFLRGENYEYIDQYH